MGVGFFERIKMGVERRYYSCLTRISPELNTRIRFRELNGYTPNLKKPVSFPEKLSWLKLYYYADNPLVQQCADKLAVRDYVTTCGYGELLNELYAVFDRVDDVDWDQLPVKYVFKWNSGCGLNIIQDGKHPIEHRKDARIKLLRRWRKVKYWRYYAELHYRKIVPKLLCERFLDSNTNEGLIDYKLYTFSGKVRAILVIARSGGETQCAVFMTPEWEYLSDIPNKYNKSFLPPRPSSLEIMIEAAEKLASPFPFVRVDFYECEDKPVFGEMTFTPAAGIDPSECMIGNKTMGELLDIPSLAAERSLNC